MSELTDVPGIGPGVADSLHDQGIDTVEDLADAEPDAISVPTGNASTLISRANQRTISSKSMADLLTEYDDQQYRSTGVDTLDDVLGGGWEVGTIGMIYGKSGKGKTQVAFSSMTTAAAEGPVVYLQTEMQSKSIAERLANLATDTSHLENITLYEAYSLEDQFNTYEKAIEEHDDLELIVIDSFTAQFRMTDEFDDRSNLSARSSEIGRHLRKLGEIARQNDVAVLLTGQVYPQPEAYGRSDKLWGGEKLKHFISYFVRMSTGQGELVTAELENHPGRAEEEVSINITDESLEGVRG